jgi:hypothetical protein
LRVGIVLRVADLNRSAKMSYTSKQWRTVIRFVDIAAAVSVVLIVALIAQHYIRFKSLIFPLEGAMFLIPLLFLRAIAVKETKKSEARAATKGLSA